MKFKPINNTQTFFGLLTLIYFVTQPLYRTTSNGLWLSLGLFSLIYIAYLYKSKQQCALSTPRPLKQLLSLCALIPVISIISYITSPIDNLSTSLLEPDTRWILIIPIIIALRAAEVGSKWVIACLIGYILSASISAFQETKYMQNLNIGANGDENAVTFGIFTATTSLMILAIFISPYIKKISPSSPKQRIIRSGLLSIFALGVITSFLSGTRAAVLLIPIVLIILYAVQYNVQKALIGSTLILLILAVFINTNQESRFVDKIITTPDKISDYFKKDDKQSKLSSTGQRLEIWKESLCIFSKHPLLGTGPRSFSPAHQLYGGTDECNATQALQHGFYQAHSVYFNTLSTLGLSGIISLGLLFLLSIKQALNALSAQHTTTQLGGLLLITVLLCHAINGLTVDLWFRNHIISKNILIWALPLVLIFQRQKQN